MSEERAALWPHLLSIWALGAVIWFIYTTNSFMPDDGAIIGDYAAQAAGGGILPCLGAWAATRWATQKPRLWAWVIGVTLMALSIAGQEHIKRPQRSPATGDSAMLCRQEIERMYGGAVELRGLPAITREEFRSHYVSILQTKARIEGRGEIPAESLEALQSRLESMMAEAPADTVFHLARFDGEGSGVNTVQNDLCLVEQGSCSCLGDF